MRMRRQARPARVYASIYFYASTGISPLGQTSVSICVSILILVFRPAQVNMMLGGVVD